MWGRLLRVLGLSALGVGLAVTPAAAASFAATFLLTCDGTNKTINLNASGFPANSLQGVYGGEVTLLENRGGLQYIYLRAEGDPNRQIVSLGLNENSARFKLPTGDGYGVQANAAGIVPLTIDGACSGGFGQVQGLVTVYFGGFPASNIRSRVANFLFTCDGTNKTVTINASGFPANSTQLVLGGEVTLFENRGGLQYLLLRVRSDPNQQILSLGLGENSARLTLTSGYFATANAAGNVPLSVDGACNGGFGQVQGSVTIYFS